MAIEASFGTYIEQYSYLGIFIWFALISQVVPIFEEVVLLTLGYLAASGLMNPVFAGMVAVFSLMLADNTFYWLARSGNGIIKKIEKKFKMLKKFETKMRANFPQTMIMITFIPRVRFFGPILAGLIKVKWWTFFLLDMLILSLYVTIYVSLGYFFYNQLVSVIEKIKVNFTFILFLLGLLVVFYFIFKKVEERLK